MLTTSNVFKCFPEKPLMIGSDIYRSSRYGEAHPLSIERVTPVIDLCYCLKWVDDAVFLKSPVASVEMLCRYHEADYVQAVLNAEKEGQVDINTSKRFNLGRNGNPIFPEVFTRAATTSGASIKAGQILAQVDAGIIHSVAGGTHHAKKGMASGFCFFNDPVLGILSLLDGGLEKVLYVDLDAHHGDGVQEAFFLDERVFTISIHEKDRWPRTGKITERGIGTARNLPVPTGLNDSEFDTLIMEAIRPIGERFQPDALVIQSGCDNLIDDPQSKLELSNVALWDAIDNLMRLAPRTLVLGGGGYNPWATARAWTGLWGILNKINPDIALSMEAIGILKSLKWDHSWGRNPPYHWYSSLADNPNKGAIRKEIIDIIEAVRQ